MVAPAVTTLGDFEHNLIGLSGIVAHGNCLVPVRIERATHGRHGFDAVLVEQLAELLQRERHPLLQLGG